MGRKIVIGDIHGCYDEFMELLENCEYEPCEDELILLGDYIDRGPKSYEVVKYIRGLQDEGFDVVALAGNHEDMFIKYKTSLDETWLWNGYRHTLFSYKQHGANINDDLEWAKSLPLYYEDGDFIYVHAGIKPGIPMAEQNPNYLLWVRERFIFSKEEFPKKVIFGHTPSLSLGNKTEHYVTEAGNICLDSSCVYGGALTAAIIENGEIVEFKHVDRKELK